MKGHYLFLFIVIIGLGCARVRVEAPKEPIKVDISMRLDIYQHVKKDIDAIENIVSGARGAPGVVEKQSFLGFFIRSAYAQEALPAEVEAAALRRKGRYAELSILLGKGVIGEDKSGLLQVREPALAGAEVEQMVQAENADRIIIYKVLARKNGTSVEEVGKMYSERLQKDAPAGSPIEAVTSGGGYEWKAR